MPRKEGILKGGGDGVSTVTGVGASGYSVKCACCTDNKWNWDWVFLLLLLFNRSVCIGNRGLFADLTVAACSESTLVNQQTPEGPHPRGQSRPQVPTCRPGPGPWWNQLLQPIIPSSTYLGILELLPQSRIDVPNHN